MEKSSVYLIFFLSNFLDILQFNGEWWPKEFTYGIGMYPQAKVGRKAPENRSQLFLKQFKICLELACQTTFEAFALNWLLSSISKAYTSSSTQPM